MTREEQIDWLCRLRVDLNNGVILTPWKKEFTEALNGMLEQEPFNDAKSEKQSEDAISRKSVLAFIKAWSLGGWVEVPEEEWNKFVLSLPPVKPQEPKTEKVIKMRDATPEEIESIEKYVKSISKTTGGITDI